MSHRSLIDETSWAYKTDLRPCLGCQLHQFRAQALNDLCVATFVTQLCKLFLFMGKFTGDEAAQLGKQIHAGLVIPCHYEMFEFNTASPERFAKTAEQIGQKYYLLKCGERLDF